MAIIDVIAMVRIIVAPVPNSGTAYMLMISIYLCILEMRCLLFYSDHQGVDSKSASAAFDLSQTKQLIRVQSSDNEFGPNLTATTFVREL